MIQPQTQRPAPSVSQERAREGAIADQRPEALPSPHHGSRSVAGPRRVSVAAHERWHESLRGGPAFDPEDELAEIADRPPSRRKEKDVSRLLAVLDEISDGKEEP